MSLITTQSDLDSFCAGLTGADYIAVDTEFMRESSYWSKLCLVQVSAPGGKGARAIDPLAKGLDLAPLLAIMADPGIVKVFHACRQDMEIFVRLADSVPAPIFDTQVAAMVCGFGDQVGYERLVQELAGGRIDKTSRFTDWSRRPLTTKQIDYALSDVTHLCRIYEVLKARMDKTGRAKWLDEEMAILTDPATYRTLPEEAWERIRLRSHKPEYVALVKALSEWRERTAQARDVPRARVLKDEQICEIAAHPPKEAGDLSNIRGLSDGFGRSATGRELLSVVEKTLSSPLPRSERPPQKPRLEADPAVIDLLKVLLRHKCAEQDVAPRLVASSADIEAIAADDTAEVPALHGWRRALFGEDALALKHGGLSLSLHKGTLRLLRKSGDDR
jgi:ribonuclease D